MRITVRISDVEVTVDRTNFGDYNSESTKIGGDLRQNIMHDSVLPTLKEAVASAKELYQLKKID